MKKQFVLFSISLLLVLVLVLGACTKTTSTITTTTATVTGTTSATTSTTEPPTSTTTPAEQPRYGGTLRVGISAGPMNVGYFPGAVASDISVLYNFNYAETLMVIGGDGNFIPVLAESYDVDAVNKTITWHLREGVTFHDGTEWNAQAAAWTFEES
jgi:peptide/nickel transport system substrate-binding protein